MDGSFRDSVSPADSLCPRAGRAPSVPRFAPMSPAIVPALGGLHGAREPARLQACTLPLVSHPPPRAQQDLLQRAMSDVCAQQTAKT